MEDLHFDAIKEFSDEKLAAFTDACEKETVRRWKDNKTFMLARFRYPEGIFRIHWQIDSGFFGRLFILTFLRKVPTK